MNIIDFDKPTIWIKSANYNFLKSLIIACVNHLILLEKQGGKKRKQSKAMAAMCLGETWALWQSTQCQLDSI